nr:MAG TPA: hypothetical protein [Caudoviricetes sp.]
MLIEFCYFLAQNFAGTGDMHSSSGCKTATGMAPWQQYIYPGNRRGCIHQLPILYGKELVANGYI